MKLMLDEGQDYTLENGSCWITVGNISVFIVKDNDGVSVRLYPLGSELNDPMSEARATYSEAENDKDNDPLPEDF
jgi:hypothetical protein